MPETTPEQQIRIETFIKEYGELVKKHQIDFATYPVFQPDGNGGFKIVVQTTPVNIAGMDKPFVATEA